MHGVPGTWAYVVMPAERSARNINMNGEIGDGRKMRLIDADLYQASLKKTLVEMEKAGDSQTDIADGVRRALRMLDMQEDISDVAPVVHGEWIAVPSSDMATGKAYKCSVCKSMRYGVRLPSYCQECGAKMDRKDNT